MTTNTDTIITDAHILIVDDTVRNIQLLGTMLREKGYQISVAQNGIQALDAVASEMPDLILLDIMMPEMDGFETCERLKQRVETRDIPVIFLTAKVETNDLIKGFELGAVDYVTKPFNSTELLTRVNSHLKLRALQKETEQLHREQEAFFRHELNNYMMPIQAYAEMLLRKSALDEAQQKKVSNILENSRMIIGLAESIRKLQSFESGVHELSTSKFALGDLIEKVISDFKTVGNEDVQIIFQNAVGDEQVDADRNLLAGVFQNLIKNAVEHVDSLDTESARAIRVALCEEDNRLVTKINNGGDPVPAEKLNSFFEKFNTDRVRKKSGTGLGTTYAYLVTKAHGGDISVASNAADGTTVTVELAYC